MDECKPLHVEYNGLTPLVTEGTGDRQTACWMQSIRRVFSRRHSCDKTCHHPPQPFKVTRLAFNLTAPFLPQTPLSNGIAVRTPIVSTAVGNRSTELVAPRDTLLENGCVPGQQAVTGWAGGQFIFRNRAVHIVVRGSCWLQCLFGALILLVKVLGCSITWSERFGKSKIVGRVLVDVDLDSAVFEVHIHKVGILQSFQKSVVAVKLIFMDGGPRGKSHCTSNRHDDDECTEKSLGQHLGFVLSFLDTVSCDPSVCTR